MTLSSPRSSLRRVAITLFCLVIGVFFLALANGWFIVFGNGWFSASEEDTTKIAAQEWLTDNQILGREMLMSYADLTLLVSDVMVRRAVHDALYYKAGHERSSSGAAAGFGVRGVVRSVYLCTVLEERLCSNVGRVASGDSETEYDDVPKIPEELREPLVKLRSRTYAAVLRMVDTPEKLQTFYLEHRQSILLELSDHPDRISEVLEALDQADQAIMIAMTLKFQRINDRFVQSERSYNGLKQVDETHRPYGERISTFAYEGMNSVEAELLPLTRDLWVSQYVIRRAADHEDLPAMYLWVVRDLRAQLQAIVDGEMLDGEIPTD